MATALVLYVAVVAGLTGVCRLLESRDEVFPYKNEDWLRYQLPAFFADDGRPRLMLAGPSTVRENLLVERFAQRFPQYRVFQGGLSQGTLVDSMVALEYAELAYGPQALPRVLILGLSPRFLAEIPAERPFSGGLDRYSGLYGTERRGAELKLVPKSSWSGLLAELRFHTRKQVPRFQAGLLAAMRPLFPYDLDRAILGLGLSKIGPIHKLAELVDLDLVLQYGPRWMLENAVSPYKYRGARPVNLDNLGRWLDNPQLVLAGGLRLGPGGRCAGNREEGRALQNVRRRA